MQQQETIRTLHIYLEEEELPIVDATPQKDPLRSPVPRFAMIYLAVVMLWGIGVPVVAILLGLAYPDTYDTTIAKTFTFTLSQHPGKGQLPLYALPPVSITQQTTVTATGSVHQDATAATGFITFYNGAFSAQTVPAGATLTGKSGIAIVTRQDARIPAATATTPPTYGTVTVSAASSVSGSEGNIAASDIDHACCGASILAQNLDAFSGGQDAQDITVLKEGDLSSGKQALATQVDAVVNIRVQQEVKTGNVLLPLSCTTTFSASHQAGDQAASSLLTLIKACTPLVYTSTDIESLARRSIAVPQGYRLVSFAAFITQSNVTVQGGTIIVKAIAYLKHVQRGQARFTSLRNSNPYRIAVYS
jgi:hypothetical protein